MSETLLANIAQTVINRAGIHVPAVHYKVRPSRVEEAEVTRAEKRAQLGFEVSFQSASVTLSVSFPLTTPRR